MALDSVQKKNFDKPDQKLQVGRSTIAVVNLGNAVHKQVTFAPGWHWSVDVEPEAEGELCALWHVFVHISGKFGIKMLDGNFFEFGPGDISVIPPGHDAWTVGNEPAVVIDHTPPELTAKI
jgi:hypothetical protein